jgi:hypothetical protein
LAEYVSARLPPSFLRVVRYADDAATILNHGSSAGLYPHAAAEEGGSERRVEKEAAAKGIRQ